MYMPNCYYFYIKNNIIICRSLKSKDSLSLSISISISMPTSITNQRFLYFALKQNLSNRVNGATVSCLPKSTSYQWGADEPIVYLDRQNIECPEAYFLTQVRLLRGGIDHDQVKYDFTCCKFVL